MQVKVQISRKIVLLLTAAEDLFFYLASDMFGHKKDLIGYQPWLF